MFGAPVSTGNGEVGKCSGSFRGKALGVSGVSGKLLPPGFGGKEGIQKFSPDNNVLSCTIVFMCFLYYI